MLSPSYAGTYVRLTPVDLAELMAKLMALAAVELAASKPH